MSANNAEVQVAVTRNFPNSYADDACQWRRLRRQAQEKVVHGVRRALHLDADPRRSVTDAAGKLPLSGKPIDVRAEADALHNSRDFDGLPYQHESTLWQNTLFGGPRLHATLRLFCFLSSRARTLVRVEGSAFRMFGCRSRRSRQRSNAYSCCLKPLAHFARNSHAARGVGMDAYCVRVNWELAAVARNQVAPDGNVHGLLCRAHRIVEQRARQTTFAQPAIRLVGTIGKSFRGAPQSH